MELLKAAIRLLEANGTLPQEYRPHKLPWQLRRHLGMPYQGRLADALAAKRHLAYASFSRVQVHILICFDMNRNTHKSLISTLYHG